jgi:hypothetical protein
MIDEEPVGFKSESFLVHTVFSSTLHSKPYILFFGGGLRVFQGVYSIEEARAMKAAGADAVYIKHEVLQGQQATEKEPKLFLENLEVAMSGDD